MTDYNVREARNIDNVEDMILANREAQKYGETDFGARQTAELNIQFKADSSYGLTRQRYGWYSNDALFDNSLFSEEDGLIKMETTATGTDSARLRSAYPGQYVPHAAAVAGAGLHIPSEHIEYDSDDRVSLTHGEISLHLVEWDESTDSGVNSAGFSFESDATYIQVRANNENTEFVPQEDWSVDSMDGRGPSGQILNPDEGLIYNIEYSWYGFGNIYFYVYSKDLEDMVLVHVSQTDGGPNVNVPNMPIQVTVENQGTADPLGARVGGMVYATHGAQNLEDSEEGRTTEVTRRTTGSTIDVNATYNNEGVDPFAEAGVPLISMRRDLDNLKSRVALPLNLTEAFLNVDSPCWLFIFDEYDDSALTGASWRVPNTINGTGESRIEVDTAATDYTPSSNATLRGIVFIGTDNKSVAFTTGDQSSRVPLEATLVMTAVLDAGVNATDAQPALIEVREGW